MRATNCGRSPRSCPWQVQSNSQFTAEGGGITAPMLHQNVANPRHLRTSIMATVVVESLRDFAGEQWPQAAVPDEGIFVADLVEVGLECPHDDEAHDRPRSATSATEAFSATCSLIKCVGTATPCAFAQASFCSCEKQQHCRQHCWALAHPQRWCWQANGVDVSTLVGNSSGNPIVASRYVPKNVVALARRRVERVKNLGVPAVKYINVRSADTGGQFYGQTRMAAVRSGGLPSAIPSKLRSILTVVPRPATEMCWQLPLACPK